MIILDITPKNEDERKCFMMLNELINTHSLGDDINSDITYWLCTTASMCLAQKWATHPNLENYRKDTSGDLSRRWHMAPEQFGPNFVKEIRIRDGVARTSVRVSTEALAFFSRDLCKRFLELGNVLRYGMTVEIANNYDFGPFIDELHLFDFMLAYIRPEMFNHDVPQLIWLYKQMVTAFIECSEQPFKTMHSQYIMLAGNIIHLGGLLRYRYQPSELPDTSVFYKLEGQPE